MGKPNVYTVDRFRRQEVLNVLASALKDYSEISFAYVFGSFSGSGPFRDIDVGVYFKPFEREKAIRLSLNLISELSEKVGLPVDVQILNEAPIPFLFHAIRGEPLFFRDEELLTDLIERTAQRYLDIAPLLRHYTKEAFAR